MPPAEPYCERFPAAVKSRLAALQAGTTYWFTPAEVTRDLKNYDETKAAAGAPSYHVIEGEIRRRQLSNEDDHVEQDIVVAAWIKNEDGEQRRIEMTRAIGDLVTAIFSDMTWGITGLETIWTRIVGIEPDEAVLLNRPFAYVELKMEINYDLPRTQV